MRTQAIILKKIPIREYDELVVCYTKEAGKQTYQAKSILRPHSTQAGHLDVLNFVDFSLVQKNSHPIITSANSLDAFQSLKSSLPALAAAYFLLECFDKLVFEGESDPKLWNFLQTKLRDFNQSSPVLNKLSYDRLFNTGGGKDLWTRIIALTRQELLQILGYDPDCSIEQLANARFASLQFARKVLR
jgi:DNA repair protein RecO